MTLGSTEDRLNPISPPGVDETTLGGYIAVHGRAVAFTAADGEPYTVAVETEQTDRGRWGAYLVFLRWAATGAAIMGHLETEDVAWGNSEQEARAALEAFPLQQVKEILEDRVRCGADHSP